MEIKAYKKDSEYSYTLGAFPTFELLKTRPEIVREIVLHSTFTDKEGIYDLAEKNHISVVTNDKLI